ncbi:MAG: alpha/beta fold hydrolase [Hyphomicrobiaceae bacterium]
MSENIRTARGLSVSVTDLTPPWSRASRPIVFQHGIGTNRDIWAGWLPRLASSRKCVRFDTRGYGQSVVPPKDHVWSMDEMLADLMEVVATTGNGPVHLIGESLGGTVVLLAAIRHPDKVASATVSNTAFKGAGIQHVKAWRDEFRKVGVRAWSRSMMERRFVQGALNEAQRSWFETEQDKSPEHVTVGLGEMLAAADLTPELPKLKCPLLILMPDRSPFVPARMATDLLEHIPQAELAMFPGVRHGLPFSHAAECADRAANFIDRAERGDTGRGRLAQ